MSAVGQPLSRVDGPAKVTGAARYAAEFAPPGLAHAALVRSTIPKGRIVAIDVSAAERAPGVCAVISHLNAPRLAYRDATPRPIVDPKSGDQLRVFQSDEILFSGQPLAVIVADTLEQARHAATLVRLECESAPARLCFDPRRGRPPSEKSAKADRPGGSGRGDAEAAFAAAPVRVDATYIQPREHHNAMELHATIAAWQGDRLTLYDKTQWVDNDRDEIARVFDIPRENIRVISPFVGGAFGSALRTWPHVTIAALAARLAGRPVSLELPRRTLYAAIGFRPHTEQRVRLGAARDGRLTAIIQEAAAQTSAYEEYAETTLDPPRIAYSCPNVRTRYRLVPMDTNSPCAMRGPGIATGLLALEIGMDELAVALGIDPLELRRRNFAASDEHKRLPWSSKELMACYDAAAERFGWGHRPARPASLREGHDFVGYGMASALYPAHRAAATAEATFFADGTASVRSAASDMGPGTYTSITQVAADALGLPCEKVRFELGDSDLPDAPVHGGSITMASIGCAVDAACRALRDKAAALARSAGETPGDRLDPELLRRHGMRQLSAAGEAGPGDEEKRFSSWAFGAVFAEVRVDADFGTVRVARIVGAYDIGRVVNPKIARSQCLGGMVGGLGMALLEAAEWDARFGRVMNANLAEYLTPVNADIGQFEAIFVPGEDRNFNPLGVKGVAELGLCGVAPAIVNAVYHATGKRVRNLPILPERLLA